MKNLSLIFLGLILLVFFASCEKQSKKNDPADISGDQSPMGEVGATVGSSSAEIAGVSNFAAVVTALDDGISTYSAQATITNTLLKNMVSNFPGVTFNGDQASITNMKIQQTTAGIKCISGNGPGVLVNYSSSVGDTYPIGSTGRNRTVVSKSETDDYGYGFFMIKTIQVEEDPMNLKYSGGVTNITYVANHKFGLVGVKVEFDDATSATFPMYSSAQNGK